MNIVILIIETWRWKMSQVYIAIIDLSHQISTQARMFRTGATHLHIQYSLLQDSRASQKYLYFEGWELLVHIIKHTNSGNSLAGPFKYYHWTTYICHVALSHQPVLKYVSFVIEMISV